MNKRSWTPEQEQAIYAKWINEEKTKRGNILVNAAAGSGKTAVLVERIIRKLIPSEDNEEVCDVNRLLVVTFTNAAAGEMQERVSQALSKELAGAAAEGDFKKQKILKRQLSLLSGADITTIDSFCLKTIRSYFHLLNIDPDFTIMDSGELELMKDDAMELLFEKMYEENNTGFINLICIYTDGRDDRNLAQKIKQIYEFIQSFPKPYEWLAEKAEMFSEKGCSAWINEALKKAKMCAAAGMDYLRQAAGIIIETSVGEDGDIEEVMEKMPPHEENEIYLSWGTYYTAVYDEYFNLKKIYEARDWEEIYKLSQTQYIDLRKKADYVNKDMQIKDKELKERVKNLRNRARDEAMREGVKKYIAMPLEELTDMVSRKLSGTVSALAELTVRFGEIYMDMKSEKNVMEFSDIEHLCLKLFLEHEEVRREFCERYEEILMDEYQDSNRLQEEIFKSISRGDNMFMVGDMKQSIYRFRSSDPTIFKEKSDTYEKDEHSPNRKIILSKNFRSRSRVLESINDIFEKIMSEAAGGIDYDADQRLNAGDMSYKDVNGDYRSECIVIEEKGEEDEYILDKTRLEARVIAAKIREMKQTGFKVRDVEKVSFADPLSGEVKSETKTVYRDLKNKDITIIMSSYKGVADIYTDELSKAGIECFAESDGYFERNEIKLVMALLKIIGNPYQDIPLLGVMRSPIFGFSDDDLVNIRLSQEGYIYSAVRKLAEDGQSGNISDTAVLKTAKKAGDFIARLEKWRGYVKYMASDKLLWTLYEETGLYGFVGALYGGEEAQANLRLLFERAKKYEKTGYKGLFNFVRYISLLKKKSEDLSTAPMVTQNHDVVRVMTIHKSKGLEFPVVFLAGAGKRFNLRDTSGDILMHRNMGFGLDYIDFEKSIKISNVTKTIIADMIRNESISEEIRKLYVALTRAKEKLIVTATVAGKKKNGRGGASELEEKWKETNSFTSGGVLACSSFIEWIAPAAVNSPGNWIYRNVLYSEGAQGEMTEQESGIEKKAESGVDVERFMKYKYPYENSSDIPSKVSVSQLKKGLQNRAEDTVQMIPEPEFLKPEKKVKGAARGTVIHYVMQKLPLARNIDEEYVKRFVEKLEETGRLLKEEAEALDCTAIAGFYNSPLGKRILKSGEVYREVPFETEISADMIDESYPADEKVILQGIIDCYFEEDGEYVLVDYKSDYYSNIEEICEKYTMQLNLYADAIEKITKKRVKNKYLYLFFGDNVVEL